MRGPTNYYTRQAIEERAKAPSAVPLTVRRRRPGFRGAAWPLCRLLLNIVAYPLLIAIAALYGIAVNVAEATIDTYRAIRRDVLILRNTPPKWAKALMRNPATTDGEDSP